MNYVLDTHTWIWLTSAPEMLSSAVKEKLSSLQKDDQLYLSSISVWEVCKLVEKGRLTLTEDTAQWIKEALDIAGLLLYPLSPSISLLSTTLPQPFHKDPGDQIIVATARHLNATLLTKDLLIRNYPHVKSLW